MSKSRNIADLGSNDVIETSASGIDVTGTVTADGLTTGTLDVGADLALGSKLDVYSPSYQTLAAFRSVPSDGINPYLAIKSDAGGITLEQNGSSYKDITLMTGAVDRLNVAANGDISFYDSTGINATFVWDADIPSLTLKDPLDAGGVDRNVLNLDSAGSWSLAGNNETETRLAWTNGGAANLMGAVGVGYQSSSGSAYLSIGDFYTAGGGYGSSGEIMRVLGNGNVGISTSTPRSKLDLGPDSTGQGWISWHNDASRALSSIWSSFSGARLTLGHGLIPDSGVANGYKYGYTGTWAPSAIECNYGKLSFYTDAEQSMTYGSPFTPTLRMTINNAGNVGIGVTPDAWASNVRAIDVGHTASFGSYSSGGDWAFVASNFYFDGANKYKTTDPATIYEQINGSHIWSGAASGTADTAITWSERMRLDSSGNLLIAKTVEGTAVGWVLNATGQGSCIASITSNEIFTFGNNTLGQTTQIDFRTNNIERGSISWTDSAVAFNTTSDERLKENIVDTSHPVNINDIHVREFDWKETGDHVRYGFIAQELDTVYPEAVTKFEDRPEKMWSVDYSKLVPLLVKEIQDLKAEVAALKGA